MVRFFKLIAGIHFSPGRWVWVAAVGPYCMLETRFKGRGRFFLSIKANIACSSLLVGFVLSDKGVKMKGRLLQLLPFLVFSVQVELAGGNDIAAVTGVRCETTKVH